MAPGKRRGVCFPGGGGPAVLSSRPPPPRFPPAYRASGRIAPATDVLDLVKLRPLMARTSGAPGVQVGLIDGPVATGLPALAGASVRSVGSGALAACARPPGNACAHGTFMAGILVASRVSGAPAICPACPLLVHPIFSDAASRGDPPEATAGQVAEAITACVAQGARVLNISATTRQPSTRAERALHHALDHAAARGVIVVASAGNQATLGSWAITRHPWIVPVASYDLRG